MSDDTVDVSKLTSIRDRDWIFNALWASCGESSAPKCPISIPVTIIFRDGKPFKCLCTDRVQRVVRRVNIDDVCADESVSSQNEGIRGEGNKLYRACVRMLRDFSQSSGYELYQREGSNEEIYVATVYYSDGEMENLSEEVISTLLRNSSWRTQVLILQGYVPSRSVIQGAYSQKPKIRSLLDSEHAAAADALTKALSKYAETAYAVSSQSLLETTPSRSALYSRLNNGENGKPLGLHVREMKAAFGLDQNDKLVFLYSDQTYVEVESGRKSLEDVISKEKSGRELTAAQSVAEELKSLLLHAQRRGLSLAESFGHFDTQMAGYFDTDMLVDGLARLGIGSTYAVAELVIQIVAGVGSAYVTAQDFERFMSGNLDEDVFATKRLLGSAGGSGLAAVASVRAQSAAASAQKSTDQLRPPKKPHALPPNVKQWSESEMLAEGESVSIDASQSLMSADLSVLDPTHPGKSHRVVQSTQKGLKKGAGRTSYAASSDTLPAPEEAYTSKPVRQNATELPSWVSQRNHRALKEIRRQHSKWLKKGGSNQQEEIPAPPPAPAAAAAAKEYGDHTHIPAHANTAKPAAGHIPGRRRSSGGNAQGLTLQGVVKDMTTELNASADQVLYVDKGVIMTYRLLLGHEAEQFEQKKLGTAEEAESSEIFKQRQWLESNATTFEESKQFKDSSFPSTSEGDEGRQSIDRFVAFTLIVFPDLFSSLDTLQSQLQPILVKFPWARIVLVGFPGLPNTAWPDGWVINTELQSRSCVKLVQFLKAERKLSSINGEPIFLIGLGTGCVPMAHFSVNFVPRISWMKSRVRVVCAVNGMLNYTKQFKGVCKELRQSLLNANAIEVNELISSLHLSDHFITSSGGRDQCLAKFWGSRDGLCSDTVDSSNAGSGFIGVLEMLRGILVTKDGFDGTTLLQSSNIPVLVVQSTEDVFVHPRTAEIYQDDKLPEHRSLVEDFADCLDTGAVHVCWLKSGHEVLLERNSYILGVISNIAQICGIRPTKEKLAAAASQEYDEDEEDLVEEVEEVFDVLAMAEKRREKLAQDLALSAAEAKQREEQERAEKMKRKSEKRDRREAKALELKRQQDEAAAAERSRREEMERQESQRLLDEQMRKAWEQEELEKQEAEKRRIKLQTDKEKRSRLAEERQRRELKAARQAELEIFYERERVAMEQRNEEKELHKMAKEDMRSRFAAEYAAAVELAFRSAILAKEKAAELARLRRAEAIERVEKKLSMERAARTQERKRRATEVVEAIRQEQLELIGFHHGGYDVAPENLDVMVLIAASQRVMMDLFECRQKHIDTMKRQMIMYQKLEMFRKQCSGVENELRRLRRAIRLIEINPSILGADASVEHELDDLRRQLARKEEAFNEMTALTKQREAQLSAADRAVQLMKLAENERDGFMKARFDQMHKLEVFLTKKIETLGYEKEQLIADKDKLRISKIQAQKRLDVVVKEYKRVKPHTGELVDTSVWVEGVLQRVHTKEFKKYLKTSQKTEQQKIKDIDEKLQAKREEIVDCTERLNKSKRDIDKLTIAETAFHASYKQFTHSLVSHVSNELVKRQGEATAVEQRRLAGRDHDYLIAQSEITSAVDLVRAKDPDLRTKDERNFVGIDLVLHPEAYVHISLVEAEQMQFDADYNCNLAKSDLERILSLPEQVNLAMPFLHTAEEVEAHRLINTFLRGHDEKYFAQADFESDRAPTSGVAGGDDDSQSTITTKRKGAPTSARDIHQGHLDEAEMIHEILVKEALRDRVRTLGAGDEPLTEDEQHWLAIDKVLCPYLFDIDELRPPKQVSERDVMRELSLSVVALPGMAPSKRKVHTDKDGELFEDMRQRYESGEHVFDDSWECPFDRNQLLVIRNKRLEELSDPSEIEAWNLMDKYYVDENESFIGQQRLKSFHEMTQRVSRHIKRSAKEEKHQAEVTAKWKAVLMQEGLDVEDMSAAERSQRIKQLSSRFSSSSLDTGGSNDSGDDSSTGSTPSNSPSKPPMLGSLGKGRSTKISRQTSSQSIVEGANEDSDHESDKDSLDDDDDYNPEDDEFVRIWGSWEQIHPASAGAMSQTSLFYVSSFSCTRDHAASYAIHPPKDPDEDDLETLTKVALGESTKTAYSEAEMQSLGMKALLAVPKESTEGEFHNHPKSKWFISENMTRLGQTDPIRVKKKVVLLAVKEPLTLLEVKNSTLQARQSRSHRFTVPNREDCRVLDITVSVLYQGSFGGMGYKLGRLAAGLFRLPQEGEAHSDSEPPIPKPVGYSPYALQTPNLPEHMGKIVIIHKPENKPIPAVTFQIVVGCASTTKYSIEVSAHIAKSALPLVDEAIVVAKQQQGRLPNCFKELESLKESMRLAERKLLVCNKMIAEAETESARCQRVMKDITNRLLIDDQEMVMFESERRELKRELSITEIEFTQWAALYESRCKEKDDIKEGMSLMNEFRRQREDEKAKLKADLLAARHDLPACISVLRSYVEATNVAASLNTTVQSPFTNYSSSGGDVGLPTVSTPAEDIRRTLKREGFKGLQLEEQQWFMLDSALNPSLYEWMREKQDKENEERIAMGKKPKELKFNAAVEAFRMSKHDIQRILVAPFTQLSRREVTVRKLLTKYHDDAEGMKKAFMASSFGFDAFLAERTRAKHPKGFTKEEKEWASIDKILHPEVWKFYATHDESLNFTDRHYKAAVVGHTARSAGMFEKVEGKSRSQRTDQTKQQLVGTLGKLLGIEDKLAAGAQSLGGPNASMEELLKNAHESMTAKADPLKPWICPWTREEILRVWKTPLHHLKAEEERHAAKILLKYNGTYAAYVEATANFTKRMQHYSRAGAHVQWEMAGNVVSPDVDLRARQLLREVDRARASDNDWLDSDVLHGQKQRFPAKVLQMHLEDELDILLAEQIKDRERAARKQVDTDTSDEDDAGLDSSEEEDEGDTIGEGGGPSESLLQRIQRRVKRREKRRMKLKQASSEKELLKVKKQVGTKNKTGSALAEAILQNQLGITGCIACRSNPCRWMPCVDVPALESRVKELDKELERVKLIKDQAIIESKVCLSAQLGGNSIFRRLDLIDELNGELTEIKRNLELNNVDKELHDAFATRKEYMEVKHLHGYAVMLWTNNARFALNQRQRRLVAYTVAKEAIDDILDWMLEGWYFGERESNFQALGYVPGVKADGMVRAGQDQIKSVGAVNKRIRDRVQARRVGVLTDQMKRGEGITKAIPVEMESQFRITEKKVAREGNQHEHMLNETESTLRFGLFMLTLMYFRAMMYLSRDKKSFSGADDELGGQAKQGKAMTDERMRMLDEENKAIARKKKLDSIMARAKVGEQRRIEREARERKEAIVKLQAVVRRQKLESDSILHIQRVFRGHLGRKAASRWALKRAELGAMNALLNATAITIQRYFRGYLGREMAIVKRMEMAQFIALMRAQEAAADEDLYWETHPLKRFNKARREWIDKNFRKAHQTEVLGGSRLTEEEEERLKNMDDDYAEESDEDSDNASQSSRSSAMSGRSLESAKFLGADESSKSVVNTELSLDNMASSKVLK